MFKAWQILIFSLVPLALVFAGVIMGSFHGVDSDKEVFKATPIPPPSAPGGASPAAGAGAASITLVARDLKYDKRSLSAPPNTSVSVVVDNRDPGVLHNFALYRNSRATDKIFVGDTFAGPASKTFTFTTPGAGSYYFRCDVHPDTMNGSFSVR